MEYRTTVAGIYGLISSRIAKIGGNNRHFAGSDDAVIDDIREGNYEAFGILVNRYENFAYTLVRGLVGDDEAAKDITQESFLRAYRSIRRFERRSSFKTWLYRIAYNTAMAHLSREKKRETGDNTAAQELIDGSYKNMDKRLLLDKIIAMLTPEYRAVIILHYYENLKYEEIAEAMNCPIGTVKIRLYRAKYELKKLWSRYGIQL